MYVTYCDPFLKIDVTNIIKRKKFIVTVGGNRKQQFIVDSVNDIFILKNNYYEMSYNNKIQYSNSCEKLFVISQKGSIYPHTHTHINVNIYI